MSPWKFVLKADDERNLADPDAGFAWFTSISWVPSATNKKGERTPDPWTEQERNEWAQNIEALRSLARRLKLARPRHPASTAPRIVEMMDTRVDSYVGKLVTAIQRRGNPNKPLSASTVGGLTRNASAHRWQLEGFWQVVFGSMFNADFATFCGSCGEVLPATAQGKLSRRRLCQACYWAQWNKRLSQSEKRARWREYQQECRKRQEKKK